VTHVCPWWFAYTFDNPVRRILHPPAQVLGRWVRPGMTVLDVGCGIGHFTLGMARLVGDGGRVIAADLQQSALAAVRRRAARAGLGERVITHRCAPGRLAERFPGGRGMCRAIVRAPSGRHHHSSLNIARLCATKPNSQADWQREEDNGIERLPVHF
jgi:SAM-dependent methyltransferase